MRHLTASAIMMALTFASLDAMAQTIGDPASGRRFALEVCTPCHLVASDQVSPPRFAKAPDFAAIASNRAMTESALATLLYSPHPTMPNLILSQAEAADVIAYIMSLKRKQ